MKLLTDPSLGLVREVRPSQLRMAASVERIVADGGIYFCDAPVGVGKTFGYLLPALLAAGKRVVVATAKKQLQDQIVNKDLPAIAKAIGTDMAALLRSPSGPQLLATPLKGKGNYACGLLARPFLERQPDRVYLRFLDDSRYGDRADYPTSPPAWWPGATAEDCIGRRCKQHKECGFIRMKGDVKQSRVVVVNHHVLGADMFYGFGQMVGGEYDVLIVDEAHKLADGIRAAFTTKVAEDGARVVQEGLARTSFQFPAVRRLVPLWHAMFEALPNRHWREAHLRDVPVFEKDAAERVLEVLDTLVGEMNATLKRYGDSDGSDPFDEPIEAVDEKMSESLAEMYDAIDSGAQDHVPQGGGRGVLEEGLQRELALIEQTLRRVDSMGQAIRTAQGADGGEDEAQRQAVLNNTAVYGFADGRDRFNIHCAPIALGGLAKRYLEGVPSVILASATLAVDENFDHLDSVVGVRPTIAEVLPPVFDYDAQGFVYVPRDLEIAERSSPTYTAALQARVDRCVRLVELSEGGAFVLTTANDELDAFAAALKRRFPGRTFVQGHGKNPWDGDPPTVLAKFRAAEDPILVGSKSFWEGVDVPGGQLRLVVITKLPFPSMSDPIVKARSRVAGASAFRAVQLVDMLVDLRQGAGRLIRSKGDRGCVAILDSRVWTKRSYGGVILKSLPWSSTTVTSDLATCERYLPRFAAYFRRVERRGNDGQEANTV